MVVLFVLCLGVYFLFLCCCRLMCVFILLVKVTEWPTIGKIATHSAYLIVSLVFSHLGFWSGNLFLIVPFPDLCLLVAFWLFGFTSKNVRILKAIN